MFVVEYTAEYQVNYFRTRICLYNYSGDPIGRIGRVRSQCFVRKYRMCITLLRIHPNTFSSTETTRFHCRFRFTTRIQTERLFNFIFVHRFIRRLSLLLLLFPINNGLRIYIICITHLFIYLLLNILGDREIITVRGCCKFTNVFSGQS